MSLKGINFNSTNGSILGTLTSTTYNLDMFKDLPSYMEDSTTESGFLQFIARQIVVSGTENDIFQCQLFLSSSGFVIPGHTVLEDSKAFIDSLEHNKVFDFANAERGIYLLSSCEVKENIYIKTFYQKAFSDSDYYYNSVISVISDNPTNVPKYLVDDRRIGQNVGYDEQDQPVGNIIYSYDITYVHPDWQSSLNFCLNPIFYEACDDKFYEGEKRLYYVPFFAFADLYDGNAIAPYYDSTNETPTFINFLLAYDVESFERIFDIKIYEDEPDDPDEPITPPRPEDPSDPIPIPPDPPVNPITSGIVNAYLMNYSQLVSLHSELFPTFTEDDFSENPLENLANEIKWIWNTLKSGMSNNYIISCHGIPVTPHTSSSEQIKMGNFRYNTMAPFITNGYVTFDFGTLSISEYYKGYEDYAITSAQLYLPFGIGYVSIPPEYWNGGSINVQYKFDVSNGSFIAYVKCSSSKSSLNDSITMQFSGSAVSNIAMTGSNYSNLISNVVSSGVASAVSGSPVPLVNEGLNIVSELQPMPSGSNDFSSSPSLMTVRYPYLLISRGVTEYPKNYKGINGYPSLASGLVGDFKGYSELMTSLDKLDFNATIEDKNEIINLLNNGIII